MALVRSSPDARASPTGSRWSEAELRARDDVERAYRKGRLGAVPTDNELVIDGTTQRLRQEDEPGEANQA